MLNEAEQREKVKTVAVAVIAVVLVVVLMRAAGGGKKDAFESMARLEL
jgi:hypothetical protein